MAVAQNSIVKFETFKIKDITFDPTNILSLDIYESLEFPGVTGRLTFQDYSATRERENIFAGDAVEISFSREQDPPLVFNFVLSESMGDSAPDDTHYNISSIKFCSPWMLEAFTRKRSRSWGGDGTGKLISEIVQELVEECGGQIGTFTPTKQTLERFVSPYWSPIDTIRYLMNFAIDENDNGGYLLWTDVELDKVNFIPIGVLMNGDTAINYGEVPFDLRMNPANERSAERILTQEVSSAFNILKYADMGMGKSRFAGFNYDKTEVMYANKKVDEYGHSHLSTKLPLNDKFMGLRYRTTKNSFLFHNTDELIRDTSADAPLSAELINGKLSNKFSLLFGDMLKIDANLVGETVDKRVGKLVKLIYPTVDDKITGENQQYTGTFLIKNIRHAIQGMQYLNAVTFVADGFKTIERDDMVEWNATNVIDAEHEGDDFDKDAV